MSQTTTDHLSDLPDSVLLSILSFLPTEYVVQTSSLSRRWRYLWTSVPTLDFNDDLFQHQRLRYGGSNVDAKMRFVDFVNKVLQLHDMSHILKFRLTCSDLDNSCVNEWIGAAVKKNVQELHLVIQQNVLQLPDCVFTCKSLVSLKLLVRNCILKVPSSVCFTRLRNLHLLYVSLNGSFGKLISSCPVLECLTMVGCQCLGGEVVNISSTTLRYLDMCLMSFYDIKISNPNLISFMYTSCFGKNCFLENLSSLIYADIDVERGSNYFRTRYKEYSQNVSELLWGVSNTRSLALSNHTLEEISNASNLSESLPSFHNITALTLTSLRMRKHFQVITYLLRSAPILKYLIIDIFKSSPNDAYDDHPKNLWFGGHLHDHLKEVKIGCFGGTEVELEFVKLLLSNASTMERVIIIEEEGFEKRTEVSEKLLMFQKASVSCNISIM